MRFLKIVVALAIASVSNLSIASIVVAEMGVNPFKPPVSIAVSSSSSGPATAVYTVKAGDCLSKIGQVYGVRYADIQVENELKTTVIHPGQKLKIPASSSKKNVHLRQSRKKAVKKQEEQKHIWKNVGANPYKGTAEWAVTHFELPEKTKAQVLENIRQNKSRDAIIGSGMVLKAVTFGQNKIWTDVTTDWKTTRKYLASDYGADGYHVVRVFWCGNWAWWKSEEKPVANPAPIAVSPAPTPKEEPIPSIISNPEERKLLYGHEFDVGGGLWWNGDGAANGDWWFGQYKAFLHKYESRYANGTVTPVIGFFARGDAGETDQNYEWNHYGIGPQAGIMWNGITPDGYPEQIQVMFRTLWEHLHGENSTSGYEKTEDHFLLGAYAEYLRQFAPDLMHVLYAEGWVDVSDSMVSTWNGDKPTSRTGFALGYKLHKQWNDDWASRFGAQIGWSDQDNQWVANANIEMRYDNWLIFGPSLDYTLASDVAGAAGGWAFGPFVRAEFKHQVRGAYSEHQKDGVEKSDRQLLNY